MQEKKMRLSSALFTIISTVVLMMIGIIGFELDPKLPLILGIVIATIVALCHGYDFESLLKGVQESVGEAIEAILILMLVGTLVAAWLFSGTVPTLIYYGINILSPAFFLPLAFLFSTLLAMALGSWGTIGTLGIALMAIGSAMGINPAMTVGAVVSGAYIGEVTSPLSDCANLASALARADIMQLVKKMLPPSALIIILSTIGFAIMGLFAGTASNGDTAFLTAAIADNFRIGPLELLPIILMAILIFLKVPPILSLFFGMLSGAIMALLLQNADPTILLNGLLEGYVAHTGNALTDQLLSAGGLNSMLETIAVIILAMSFGGIMRSSDQIKVIGAAVLKHIKKDGQLQSLTVITALFCNIIIPDQALGMALPGQIYALEYQSRNLDNVTLGQQLLIGGGLSSPLVPWNTCGIYTRTMLGISATAYLPYCLGSLLFILLGIIRPLIRQSSSKAPV